MISNERAGEELGWRASTPLREGVSRYLAWLEPERAQAAEPEPVAAAEPAPAPVAAVASVTKLSGWPSTSASSWPSAWIVALACVAGTLIPSALAIKSDDFGSGQAGYVAITCLIAILADLCRSCRSDPEAAARPGRGDRGLADRRLRRARDAALDAQHLQSRDAARGTVAAERDGPGDRAGGGHGGDPLARRRGGRGRHAIS